MKASRRLALALLFLAAAGGLCVVEAATYEQRWPYPTGDELAADDGSLVGERVLTGGTVQKVDGASLTIEVTTDHSNLLFAVEGVDERIQPGAIVRVLGTLESDATIVADRLVVVSPTPGAERFKWLVSFGAVLLFGWLFLREWRVDLGSLRVEVREDG